MTRLTVRKSRNFTATKLSEYYITSTYELTRCLNGNFSRCKQPTTRAGSEYKSSRRLGVTGHEKSLRKNKTQPPANSGDLPAGARNHKTTKLLWFLSNHQGQKAFQNFRAIFFHGHENICPLTFLQL